MMGKAKLPLELPAWMSYLAAVSGVLALSLALLAVRLTVSADHAASAPLLLLLVVLGVAIYLGLRPAILASVVASFCYNYFFQFPYYELSVARVEDILATTVFVAVAIVGSAVVTRLNQQLYALTSLNRLSQSLLASANLFDPKLLQQIAADLGADWTSIQLELPADGHMYPDQVAWAYPQLQVSNVNTEVRLGWHCVTTPLQVGAEVVGTLKVERSKGTPFSQNEQQLLRLISSFLASAFERRRLSEQAAASVQLQAADEVKDALLAAVSHELRTPLTTIRGAASTLLFKDNNLDVASQQELLEVIGSESEYLSELVSNLLNLSRLEAGILKPCREGYFLDEVAHAAGRRVASRLQGHDLQFNFAPNLPTALIDYCLIEQVLVMLLDNAIKYTPLNSVIALNVMVEGEWLKVSIEDEGPGLAENELTRIFDRFYRTPSSSGGQPPGMGLGLALARGFVEAHGGQIVAYNRSASGLAVVFTLPITCATLV